VLTAENACLARSYVETNSLSSVQNKDFNLKRVLFGAETMVDLFNRTG